MMIKRPVLHTSYDDEAAEDLRRYCELLRAPQNIDANERIRAQRFGAATIPQFLRVALSVAVAPQHILATFEALSRFLYAGILPQL